MAAAAEAAAGGPLLTMGPACYLSMDASGIHQPFVRRSLGID